MWYWCILTFNKTYSCFRHPFSSLSFIKGESKERQKWPGNTLEKIKMMKEDVKMTEDVVAGGQLLL